MSDILKKYRYEILLVILFLLSLVMVMFAFQKTFVRLVFVLALCCLFIGIYYLRDTVRQWKSINKTVFFIFLIAIIYSAKGIYSIISKYTLYSWYCMFGVIFGLLLVCLLELVYTGLFLKHWKLERLFLVSALLLGPIYMVNLPLNTTPDEDYHFNSAYKMSSVLMGLNSCKDETFLMRKCDSEYKMPARDYDFYGMESYLLTFNDSCGDLELVTNSTTRVFNSPQSAFMYLVPGLGILVARLCNMNTAILGLMGSLANFLLYLIIGYWAVKKMPFNKLLCYGVLLLPMTLQQCTSLSYDTIAISLSVFVVSFSFYLFDKQNITKCEYIVQSVAMFFLFFTKSKAYFAIALFPIFMLILKNRNLFSKYRKVFYFCSVAILVLIVSYIGIAELSGGNLFYDPGKTIVIDETEFAGYSFRYCLNHPLEISNMFINTTMHYIYGYVTMMVGSALGWVNVIVPDFAIFVYILCLILFSIKRKDDQHTVSKKIKLYLAIATLITYVGVLTALLMDYTPRSFAFVYGVQGRYFLPVLIPAMLLIHSNVIEIEKKADKYLIFVFILNAIFTVFSIYPRL